MKKIMDTVPLDIIPFSKGFLYARRESNFNKNSRPSFFAYSIEERAFAPVTKSAYLFTKFGPAFRQVCSQLADVITCDAGVFSDMRSAVMYPSGEIGFFKKNGEIEKTGDLVYHNHSAQGIAVDGNSFWSVVPDGNSVVKYSPLLSRVVFRIGSSAANTFERPCSIARAGHCLYVCNLQSNKIRLVDLDTYAVKDYRLFSEPVYKYLRSAEKEFVVLNSGTYML